MSAATTIFDPPGAWMRGLRNVAFIGAAVFLLGLVFEPTRAWGGFLIAFCYIVGLALAGGLFLAVLKLANARWAGAMMRIPEAMTGSLPFAFLLGLVLLSGVHSLYEWSHSGVVDGDALLQHKSGWLNYGGFTLRLVAYFALWIPLARRLVAHSRRAETPDGPAAARGFVLTSVLFMAVFAITFSLACVDWTMSLEPHWFSTIYALGGLAGLANAGLAVCMLAAAGMRRWGGVRSITPEHLDDLGKVAIGLSLFWAYIWYCQYMLIWYTNLPEETAYFVARRTGDWAVLTPVSLVLNWLVPFLALMPRRARRSETIVLRVAAVMLVGRALELFLLIEPPLMGAEPSVGLWEIGPTIGALALFLYVTLRGLARAPRTVMGRDTGSEWRGLG